MEQEVIPQILGRGAISISFYIPDPEEDEEQSGELEGQVKRTDGIKVRKFDLLAVLAEDQEGQNVHLPALSALKEYILTRFDTEVLGL
jgi:hypothetical protein